MANLGVDPPYNKTKKAFREAVREDPKVVRVYTTSPFGLQFGGRVSELPEGEDHYVVGPWPSRERRWYASLSAKSGRWVVK